MGGFSLKKLFSSYDEKDGDLAQYNYIGDEMILSIFSIFISLVGLVGNGRVIWLLGFHVKKKSFATYILNLAVADFGSLLFVFTLDILYILPRLTGYLVIYFIGHVVLMFLLMFMYSSSLLLLTAISLNRCMSAFFPNWYRRHQLPVLSTRVCIFIWPLSFVLTGVFLVLAINVFTSYYMSYVYWGTVLVCLLLMILSTLTLFIKVCFQSQPCQGRNLLKVVLLMLLSFLLFTTLTCVCVVMHPFGLEGCFELGASLKSSINPLIYFLAGRQKGGKFCERMKVILQKVFKEEIDIGVEQRLHYETRL